MWIVKGLEAYFNIGIIAQGVSHATIGLCCKCF